MIVLIDNYDSFSYNLYQLLGKRGEEIRVYRNDEKTPKEILADNPSHLLLSPGPGRPDEAGVCEALLRFMVREKIKIPLLGVCLGHQAICEALGGEIKKAGRLMHGKQSRVYQTGESPLFAGLEEQFLAGRYHSLAAREKSLPEALRVTARTKDGEIMAVQHESLPIFGVQFHPESILTPVGEQILQNFAEL